MIALTSYKLLFIRVLLWFRSEMLPQIPMYVAAEWIMGCCTHWWAPPWISVAEYAGAGWKWVTGGVIWKAPSLFLAPHFSLCFLATMAEHLFLYYAHL